MDVQRQHDQLEPTYNSFVPIQEVAMKTYPKRGTIEKCRGRGWGNPSWWCDTMMMMMMMMMMIYVHYHPQKDCSVVSQLVSVVKIARCFKLGTKLTKLYIRLMTYSKVNMRHNVSLGMRWQKMVRCFFFFFLFFFLRFFFFSAFHFGERNIAKLSYLPTPSARAGYDKRSIFKRSLTGLNSEFSFSWTSCLTKAEEPCLSYSLPVAGGRIIGFISFPRVLVLCEIPSVSSRIWTRVAVAVSITYDDNHYITGTSISQSYTQYKNFANFLLVLFTNPYARAGYNTRSIFKRSLTGLNSEFSFS